MSSTSIAKLARGLDDFESRHLQVEADVHVGIPLQIRTMRETQEWNQTQLGEKIGTTQNAISRLESGSYGRPNVRTLLRLAEAFDVALLVKFVPFSHFVRTLGEMSSTSVVVPSFDEDKELQEMTTERIFLGHLESELPGPINVARAGPHEALCSDDGNRPLEGAGPRQEGLKGNDVIPIDRIRLELERREGRTKEDLLQDQISAASQ